MIRNTKNETANKERNVVCSQCKVETIHKVLTSIRQDSIERIDENCSVDTIEHFEIIECQGCKTISFRKQHQFSEVTEPDGTYTIREFYYPVRGRNFLIEKEFTNVSDNLLLLYSETLNSFNNHNLLLCSAGVRAMVECICKDKNIENGEVEILTKTGTKKVRQNNLRGKINGLFEKGFLTKSNIEILHEHRFLGNSALHEQNKPTPAELATAINIVEHIIEDIYEIPHKGEFLKSKRVNKSER